MTTRHLGTGNLALDVLVRQAESRLSAEPLCETASQGLVADLGSPTMAGFMRLSAPQDQADAGAGAACIPGVCNQGDPGCIQRRRSPGLGSALRGASTEHGRRAESEFAVRDRHGLSTALRAWVSKQLEELRAVQRDLQAQMQRQLEQQRGELDAGLSSLQGALSSAIASQRDALEARLSASLGEQLARELEIALGERRASTEAPAASSFAPAPWDERHWEEHLRSTASALQTFEAKVDALSRRAESQPDPGAGLLGVLGEHTAELGRLRTAQVELGHRFTRLLQDVQDRVAEQAWEPGSSGAQQEVLEASVEGLRAFVEGLEGRILERLEDVSQSLEDNDAKGFEGGAAEKPWEAHARATSSALQALEARFTERLAQASEEQKETRAALRASAASQRGELDLAKLRSGLLGELQEQIAKVSEQEKAAREALQRSVGSRLAEESSSSEARRVALQATLDALHAEHAVEFDSLQSKMRQLEQRLPSEQEVSEQAAKATSTSLQKLKERMDTIAKMVEDQRRIDLAMHGLAAEHASELKGHRTKLQELATGLTAQQAQSLELAESLSQLRERGERSCHRPRPVGRSFTEQVMDLDQAKLSSEEEEDGGRIRSLGSRAASAFEREREWLMQMIEREREARAEFARELDAEREARGEVRAELARALEEQLAEAVDAAREEWASRASEAMAQLLADVRSPIDEAERAASEAARRAAAYAEELAMADTERSGRPRDTAALREAVASVSQRLAELDSRLDSLAEGSRRPSSSHLRDAALEVLRRELREEVDEVRGDCASLARRSATEARASLNAQLEAKLDAKLEARLEATLSERLARLEGRLEAAEARSGAPVQARAHQGRSPSQGRPSSQGRAGLQGTEPSAEALAAAARRTVNAQSLFQDQIS